jgi:hypothetical protein
MPYGYIIINITLGLLNCRLMVKIFINFQFYDKCKPKVYTLG